MEQQTRSVHWTLKEKKNEKCPYQRISKHKPCFQVCGHGSAPASSTYLSPGGRVPVQARRALAGHLRWGFVEDSLAVEGPQEPLVPGVDAVHVPNLHPSTAVPGALGKGEARHAAARGWCGAVPLGWDPWHKITH